MVDNKANTENQLYILYPIIIETFIINHLQNHKNRKKNRTQFMKKYEKLGSVS